MGLFGLTLIRTSKLREKEDLLITQRQATMKFLRHWGKLWSNPQSFDSYGEGYVRKTEGELKKQLQWIVDSSEGSRFTKSARDYREIYEISDRLLDKKVAVKDLYLYTRSPIGFMSRAVLIWMRLNKDKWIHKGYTHRDMFDYFRLCTLSVTHIANFVGPENLSDVYEIFEKFSNRK